jgi:phosphate transport system permease protein
VGRTSAVAMQPPRPWTTHGEAAAGSIRARRLRNRVARAAALLSVGILGLPLAWLLAGIAERAVPHLGLGLILHTTQGGATGARGAGLANALAGSALVVASVAVVGGTVGVLAGIWLAELAPPRLSGWVRRSIEVLSGVPSIVLGYAGYLALVVGLGWRFSLAAAVVVLSVLVVPYVATTTEHSIAQVPSAYREGAHALGIPETTVLRRMVVRPAMGGITTGIVLALAIGFGETAPLLYTAGWSDQMPHLALLHSPVGYLTYVVYAFYNEPSNTAHVLSYEAAFFLMIVVVVLIAIARLAVRASRRWGGADR